MTSLITRRQLLRNLGIAAAGALVAACQPAPAPTPVPQATEKPAQATVPAAPAKVVELQVTHSWPAELWPRQEQFDQTFNKEHPNIKVTGVNIVWADYVPKLPAAAAAGSMPDSMYCQ